MKPPTPNGSENATSHLPRRPLFPLARVFLARNEHAHREAWLADAVGLLGDIFAEAGVEALPPVRVSCSWPGGGSPRKRIGECWCRAASAAGVNEVFISPAIDDTVTVLATLAHELCHAVDDCKSGHKAPFARLARAIGLEGKLTATHAGPVLKAQLEVLAEHLGPYPHKRLTPGAKKPRQAGKGRYRCDDCNGEIRVPARQLRDLGEPGGCPWCSHQLSAVA